MRKLDEQELKLLRLVAAEPCGLIDQEDKRLNPFCDDRSTLSKPDAINRCFDLGWLKAWNDDRTGGSAAEITEAGRAALQQS